MERQQNDSHNNEQDMNGNKIIICILDNNKTPIAATKSNELSTGAETIEVSSPMQGAWRAYIAGRKEWSVTTSFLVHAVSDITQCLNVGTEYTLCFCENKTGYPSTLQGKAMLQSSKITATRGNVTQGSFQFVGISELKDVSSPSGGLE